MIQLRPLCLMLLVVGLVLVDKSFAQTSLTHVWSKALNNYQPGKNEVIVGEIDVDNADNVYLIGSISGIADFDPSGATALRGIADRRGIFIAKYSAAGVLAFANVFYADTDYLVFSGIDVDNSGNIHVCGYWRGIIGLNPATSQGTLSCEAARFNFFFAKYNSSGSLLYANGIGSWGDDEARDIAVDDNGNVIVVGQFVAIVNFATGGGTYNLESYLSENSYKPAFFLAKYNSSGHFVYAKALTGTISYVEGIQLELTPLGNPVIAGSFHGTYDFDPGPGVKILTEIGDGDLFLAGYDGSGSLVFAHGFGSSGYDEMEGLSINVFEGILFAAEFADAVDIDPGPGTPIYSNPGRHYIARYNFIGNLLFAGRLGINGNIGDAAFDADGNILLAGWLRGESDFDPGPNQVLLNRRTYWFDTFLAKYDYIGNYLDAKAIHNLTSDFSGLIYSPSLKVNSLGKIILSRPFRGVVDVDPAAPVNLLSSNIGFQHSYILGFSADLALESKMQIGGFPTATYPDEGRALCRDASGNIYLAAKFSGHIHENITWGTEGGASSVGFDDVYIAKYNAAGVKQFGKGFGSVFNDNANDIGVDAAGNVYVTGTFQGTADFDPGAGVFNLTSAGGLDIFLLKLNASGEFVYARRIGGMGPDVANGLSVDAAGNVVLAGSFTNTADFDPGAGTANLVSAGFADIFFARYDASGNYVFAKRIGGSQNDEAKDVVMDADGNCFITGVFLEQAGMDFDPNAGAAWLYSDFLGDVFIARYDANGNYSFAKKLWGTGNETVAALALDGYGYVTVLGDYTGTFFIASNTLPAGNYNRVYFAKFDAAGNNLFARSIGGSYDVYAASLAIGCGESIWATGYFSRTIDFDPGGGVANLVSNNNSNDVFIAKYDLNGDYVYAGNVGGISDDRGTSITGTPGGRVYVTGKFEGFADFNPGPAELLYKSDNSTDIFIAAYQESTTSLKTYKDGSWFDPATWGNCKIPDATTPVVVDHQVTVPENAECRSIMVRPTGKIQLAAGKNLKVMD